MVLYLKVRIPFYLLALTSLLFLGCQSNQESINFPRSQSLSGQPVENIEVYSKGNVYLTVADTFLVIQKNKEPFVQIYSTITHKLLSEFGKEGKGPGEFIGPSLQKQVDYDPTNNSPVIYIFDYKRQILSKINILNIIKGDNVILQEKLPGDSFLTFFHYRGDNYYIASPASRGRFQIYNYQTSKDTTIPYLPKTDFKIPPQTLPVVYRTTAVINVEKSIMAAAPLYLGELDFFDLKGNYLRSSIWTQRDKFKMELTAGSESFETIKNQIVDIDAKDGLIYGLNRNVSVVNSTDRNSKPNMKVQIFNWKGDAVKEYSLDDRRIMYFAIDSVHNRIYAYSPDEKNNNLITYQME